jgi:hypothetical protein
MMESVFPVCGWLPPERRVANLQSATERLFGPLAVTAAALSRAQPQQQRRHVRIGRADRLLGQLHRAGEAGDSVGVFSGRTQRLHRGVEAARFVQPEISIGGTVDIVDAKRIGARRIVRVSRRHRDLVGGRFVSDDLDALLSARAAFGIEVGDGVSGRARHANGDIDPALIRDHDRALACAEH